MPVQVIAVKPVPVLSDDDIDHAFVLEIGITDSILGIKVISFELQPNPLAGIDIATLPILIDEKRNSSRLPHVSNSTTSATRTTVTPGR